MTGAKMMFSCNKYHGVGKSAQKRDLILSIFVYCQLSETQVHINGTSYYLSPCAEDLCIFHIQSEVHRIPFVKPRMFPYIFRTGSRKRAYKFLLMRFTHKV